LRLQNNNISTQGAMSIASALISNETLTLLDLSGNNLKSAGVKLIVESLRGNRTLKTLMINQNGACSEGAYSLADLLLDPSSHLVELHIADNLISSVGLNSILQALAISNKRLKYLDFSGNFISIDIIHALRCMIEKNTTLSYLTLSDIFKWQDAALILLAESFVFNKTIKEINLKTSSQQCLDLF
jgi:Ran GTPase-activating protein (RanGAP) involved in mRNA processing and transport